MNQEEFEKLSASVAIEMSDIMASKSDLLKGSVQASVSVAGCALSLFMAATVKQVIPMFGKKAAAEWVETIILSAVDIIDANELDDLSVTVTRRKV